jgi:hypothetical protein
MRPAVRAGAASAQLPPDASVAQLRRMAMGPPSNRVTAAGEGLAVVGEGQACAVEGRWECHPKYGMQVRGATVRL